MCNFCTFRTKIIFFGVLKLFFILSINSSINFLSYAQPVPLLESAHLQNNFCLDPATGKQMGNERRAQNLWGANDFLCSPNAQYKLILQSDKNLCAYKYNPLNGEQIFQWCMMLPFPAYGLPADIFAGKFGLNSLGEFGVFEFCPRDGENKLVAKLANFINPQNKKFVLDNAGTLQLMDENQSVLWDSVTGKKSFDSAGHTPCDYFSSKNPENVISSFPKPPLKYGSFYTKYAQVQGVDILATPSVRDEKLQLVTAQYEVMLNSLKNPIDREYLKGVRVFLMSKYDKPSQMTFFYFPNQPQNYYNYLNLLEVDLRGSTFNGGDGAGSLLITDEMICTKGVATRGPSDKAYRGLDQVVHEMGHKFDYALNLTSRPATIEGVTYNGLYDLIEKNGLNFGGNSGELVAYSFQHFFEQCYDCKNSKKFSTTPADMNPKIKKYFEAVIFNPVPAPRIIRCDKWD